MSVKSYDLTRLRRAEYVLWKRSC